ncbi:hypothetical protein [Apilactobacillus quenuiae]|uniref:hypothetical protein n=1 Tax=Apilactobacillus quenuiae TaxID=2008377 RepID=UPI000D01EC7E|nr:hypothetical protein [Apilactobacillus quenuiae]
MDLDIGTVIDDFANSTVTVLHKTKGQRVGGDWIDGNTDKTKIKEPLIPNDKQSKLSYFDSGQVELCDATLYSHHNEFEIDDEVIDDSNNQKYTIVDKTDYTNYSTVVFYGLKAVNS